MSSKNVIKNNMVSVKNIFMFSFVIFLHIFLNSKARHPKLSHGTPSGSPEVKETDEILTHNGDTHKMSFRER